MSGHSKWSTIKRQKQAKDAARGAVFTKLGNAIAVAARSGTDPESNFGLRLAIDRAKALNMPLANIQRSIDRVKDKSASAITEALYEGYGPGGVAILVEVATDNVNRTLPDVKVAITKHGGRLAEKGAVAFLFDRRGLIRLDQTGDEAVLAAIEAGALDVTTEDDQTVVYTSPTELAKVRDQLEAAGYHIAEAELSYVPKSNVTINDKETAGKVIRLMDALEDITEVVSTYVNFDIPEEYLS